MQDVITIGRRFVPVEQIAFVEPFDPAANPDFKPDKDFKARVVLLNRDTVLAEVTPKEFAEARGFRMLEDDGIAVNPAIAFRVETFAPSEAFSPAKAYLTRLKWRDLDGNDQSKLLLSAPEAVIAVVLRGGAERDEARNGQAQRPARSRVARSASANLESARS